MCIAPPPDVCALVNGVRSPSAFSVILKTAKTNSRKCEGFCIGESHTQGDSNTSSYWDFYLCVHDLCVNAVCTCVCVCVCVCVL